jgi:adenylate cyclase
MRAARIVQYCLLPIGALLVAGLFGFTPPASRLAGGAYDLLLAARKSPPPAPEILLLDLDERAMTEAGPWPWSRDKLADGLVDLAEMEARSVVLDLPLGQKSAPALDPSALRSAYPETLNREFTQMETNIQTLFEAIRRGSVRPQDSQKYVSDLVGLIAMARVRLLDAATGIERDDDASLGRAASFFGRTFVAVDLLPAPDETVGGDVMDEALRLSSLPLDPGAHDPSLPAGGIRPPVLPVMQGARGAGFPNIAADADGVIRRASLTARYAGSRLGQAGLAALLDFLGSPGIELRPGGLLLHGAVMPDATSHDIRVPFTESGKMLLRWPRDSGGDGFRHVSWAELLRYQALESSLVAALTDMDKHGYLSYLRSDTTVLDEYAAAAKLESGMLAAGAAAGLDDWRSARDRFFVLADQFLNGDAEDRIVADADRALRSAALSEAEKRPVGEERDRVPAAFADARATLADLAQVRSTLKQELRGSFCIVSLPQARKTVSPFGVPAGDALGSAALVNTILSGRFLREAPARTGYIIAACLLVLGALGALRMKPLATVAAGTAFAAVSAALLGAIFVLFGTYVSPVVPSVSVLLAGAGLSILKLSRARRSTRALRASLDGRISADGMRRLLSAPRLLSPQGLRRSVTVLAAAAKGLPAAAASKDPAEVIELLNSYHAAAGEVILGMEGMLGSTGADALIAYFGAPLDVSDHAVKACRAALRLKAVEGTLNIIATPPFATRIGIDTGECVLGEIGREGTPGYSVVGSATDLAGRLEGLNARYGTSILVSEKVRDATGGAFILRSLEKVRIAGTATTFRVLELVAERDDASPAVVEAVEAFNEGFARFEEKEWQKALALFARALAILPEDGPSARYVERCRDELTRTGGSTPTEPC